MPKIYTKTGDNGETSLIGGKRIKKNNIRLHAYGEIDELNSLLGVCISHTKEQEIKEILQNIQHDLFTIGTELATPSEAKTIIEKITLISEKDITKIEKWIDQYDKKIPPLNNFILPGGTIQAAHCHQARTVCRRVERTSIHLHEQEPINPQLIKYLNRLSDLLFTIARYLNHHNNHPETTWKKKEK